MRLPLELEMDRVVESRIGEQLSDWNNIRGLPVQVWNLAPGAPELSDLDALHSILHIY